MSKHNRYEFVFWILFALVIWLSGRELLSPTPFTDNQAYPGITPSPSIEAYPGPTNSPPSTIIANAPLYTGHTPLTEYTPLAGTPTPSFTPWPLPTHHAFPPALTPRQGVGASWQGTPAIVYRGYFGNWANMWSAGVPETPPAPITPPPGSNPPIGNDYLFEYVPMIAGGNYGWHFAPSVQNMQINGTRTPHDYWLVFNECEHNWQCDSTPEEAAIFYHDQILPLVYAWGGDPNAQLIVGGVNANPCGILWLQQFVHAYQERYTHDLPRAGWHFHFYPEVAPHGWQLNGPFDPAVCGDDWVYNVDLFGLQAAPGETPLPPFPTATGTYAAPIPSLWPYWQQQTSDLLHNFLWVYGRRGNSLNIQEDQVWITEMGCIFADWVPENSLATPLPGCNEPGYMYEYARLIMEWLNNEGRWVDRYSWYADWHFKENETQTSLFDLTVTPLINSPTPTSLPTLSPTPGPSLTPTYFPPPLRPMGDYYIHLTPAAPIPKPWPTHFVWLPIVGQP